MKFIVPLVALLVFSTIVVSCKKIQPEMTTLNEECDCAKEVSSEFSIEELSEPNVFGFYTETDTSFENKNIRFTALQDDAEYTWYIGTEVLTGQSFLRYFDNTTAGTDIPVTLVVRKTPNNICFPNDDGYDSITKVVSIVSLDEIANGVYNMEGTYRLMAPHLSDSVEIDLEFYYAHPLINGNYHSVMVYNWDGQGAECEGNFGGGMFVQPPNYREFETEITTNCGDVKLNMARTMTNEIILNVEYREGSVIKYYYYKGRKL